MNPNLKVFTPEVFKADAVQRHGVVYAESRRTDDTTLAGNMHDNDLVISEKNFQRINPGIPFNTWADHTRQGFIDLSAQARDQLGLEAIGHPTPVHGIDLIDLDKQMRFVQPNVFLPKRPKADATVVSKLGYASCFSPADCVISNIVDTRTGTLSQIHTGYKGLEHGIIDKTLTAVGDRVNPKDSVVYLSPNTHDNFVINQVNNFLVDSFAENPVMQPFLTYRENGEVSFNLTAATIAQLEAAGIKADHIDVSPDNSTTDPTLFSQSKFLLDGINGRNGIIFGRTNKLQ